MDNEWIAIGLANSRVHVFSVATGVLARTLSGHEAGVWSLWLVSRGGASGKGKAEEGTEEVSVDSTPSSSPGSDELPFQSVFDALNPEDSSSSRPNSSTPVAEEQDPTEEQSDPCNASRGWGQTNALVVSGSCDKMIRVWDIKSGWGFLRSNDLIVKLTLLLDIVSTRFGDTVQPSVASRCSMVDL